MNRLAAAIATVLTLLALAACKGTAGVECYKPGAIRVEHPNPSTTDTFRCVTDPGGHHAHWVPVRGGA